VTKLLFAVNGDVNKNKRIGSRFRVQSLPAFDGADGGQGSKVTTAGYC